MTRLIAILGAAALLAVGAVLYLGQRAPAVTDALVGAANAQDAADVDTSTIVEMVQGAADAPVTMIEYASFTCPHCAAFHQGTYQEIKKNYIDTGKVKLVYREVYFDKYGLWASMVARCGGPEKFFGISDLIYKGQSEWSKLGGAPEIVNEFRKIGRLAGIGEDELDVCLQDADKAQTLVAWYQANAAEHEITGTPSFVVNGEKVANQSYAEFAELFDAELGN
ncbi:DsbA family protein [Sedimentitalea todarodis]|uniref:DsbA family protein n=1 Tax=Sedimentitalea todarodis TaxID=1631240 RepID=A0ABU3VGA5_9RHOB|nr:DsbA family protein [Sedimentitalea todarodis]MDU9005208.1 DsbA family protein [Sedimentitalea todarodis]